jgi:uncharacterized protein (TIGR00255 family)
MPFLQQEFNTMIDSMTAFAREQYRGAEGDFIWELRSVNHRYLEVFVRLPEELRGLDPMVRERVGARLQRGKLDCTLRYQSGSGQVGSLSVNHVLVQGLQVAADELAALLGCAVLPTPMELMRWPGVLQEQPVDLTPVQVRAGALLEQALDSLAATRRREGVRLQEVIRRRSQALRDQAGDVRARIPTVLMEVRQRLAARLQEVLGQLDPVRLEQEMVLLAQRLDVDEEMERLVAHLDEVDRVLDQGGAVGRRLDFLMQELNRETNTLTSKTSDVEITRRAVDMKVLIEQMREQIQNLE